MLKIFQNSQKFKQKSTSLHTKRNYKVHSYNIGAKVGLFAGKLVLYATDTCIESCTVLYMYTET